MLQQYQQRLVQRLANKYRKSLEKKAKKVKDRERLQAGSMVRYAPEPRPTVICPSCEVTSETIGEPATLEGLRNKVGVVWMIEDPKDAPTSTTCSHCHVAIPMPPFFIELGTQVLFKKVNPAIPPGVYAAPSELTIISKQEWENGP